MPWTRVMPVRQLGSSPMASRRAKCSWKSFTLSKWESDVLTALPEMYVACAEGLDTQHSPNMNTSGWWRRTRSAKEAMKA